MGKTKERIRPIKTIRYIIAGIILCILVGAVGYAFGSRNTDEVKELSAVVLENQMMEMSELVSVTYAYTNMARYESTKEFYGVTLPLTTNGFILTYDGVIKAGVDLKKAEIVVEGTAVQVTLPEPTVLSHEIDEDSVEIYDEKTSIFNPFTVKDYTDFYADQKKEMEAKADSKGLLKEAKSQAKESVRLLLSSSLPAEYTITVQ